MSEKEVKEKMLYELVAITQYLPKVTLAYVALSFLNGMAISNIVLGVTLAFDLLDFIPLG